MVQAWDSEGNKSQKPMTFVVPTCLFDDLQDEIPTEEPGDDEKQDDGYEKFEIFVTQHYPIVGVKDHSRLVNFEVTLISPTIANDVNFILASHHDDIKWVNPETPKKMNFVPNERVSISAWFFCEDVVEEDWHLEVEFRNTKNEWIKDKGIQVTCVATEEEQDDLTGGGQDPVYPQFEMNILPVDDFVEYVYTSTKLDVEITLVSSDSADDVNLHFYSHSNEVKWVNTQSPQLIDFVTNIPQTITARFSCDDVTNDGSLEVELRDSADQWIMDKEVKVACVAPEDEQDEIEPFVPTFDRFFHGDDLTIKFVGLEDYDEKPVISKENWPFGGWEFEVEITNHEKSKRFRDFTFAFSNPSFDDGIEALPRGIGPILDMTFNPESTTSIRSVGWCYEEGDHVLSANVLSQADSSARSEWIKITCVLPDSGTDDPPPIDDGDEQQPKSPKIGMSMSSEEPIQSVGVSWPVDFTVSYSGEQSQNYDLFYFSDDYLVVTPIEPDPNLVSFSPGDEKTYLVNFECLIPGTTEYGLEADKDGSFAKDIFDTVTCVLSDGGNDDPPPIDDGDQTGTKVDYTELFPVLPPCLVHTIEIKNGNEYRYGDDCTLIEYSDRWVHVNQILGITETKPKVEIPCQTWLEYEYTDGTVATLYVEPLCSDQYDGKIVFPDESTIDVWFYCDKWGFYDAAGHPERGC